MWRRRALLAERLVVDLTRERDVARALVAERAAAKGDPEPRPAGGGRITLGPDGRMRGYDAAGQLVFDTVAPTERTALMAQLINRCSTGPAEPDVVDTAERCGDEIGRASGSIEVIAQVVQVAVSLLEGDATGDAMKRLIDILAADSFDRRSGLLSVPVSTGRRRSFADGGD